LIQTGLGMYFDLPMALGSNSSPLSKKGADTVLYQRGHYEGHFLLCP